MSADLNNFNRQGCQKQANEMTWDQNRGWQTVEVYDGPQAAAKLTARSLAESGLYTNVRVYSADNVVYRVQATVGGFDGPGHIEPPEENWRVQVLGIQESVFNHDRVRSEIPADIVQIIKDIDAGKIDLNGQEATLTFSNYPLAAQLWNLIRNNQEAYQDAYYVLQHTQVASHLSVMTKSTSYVGYILNVDQLPPQMPSDIKVVLQSIAPRPEVEGFREGYLKQGPVIDFTIGGRVTVTQEYWLYRWSTLLYPSAPNQGPWY